MKKIVAAFLLMIGFSAAAMAQTSVAVTATIAGPNGLAYINGSYNISLVDVMGVPVQSLPGIAGSLTQQGFLNLSGALAVNLYTNTTITTPPGTQWRFNICSPAPTLALPLLVTGQHCFTSPVSITAAGDISSTLNASAPSYYGFNSLTGALYASIGSPAAFPANPGIVFNTSTTASRNAVVGDLTTLLGSTYVPAAGGTFTGTVSILSTNNTSTSSFTFGNTGTAPTSWVFQDLPQFNSIALYSSNQFGAQYVFAANPSYSGSGAASYFPFIGYTYGGGLPNNSTSGGMIYSTGAQNLNIVGGTSAAPTAAHVTASVAASSIQFDIFNPSAAKTVVNCSTSGTATFSEPFQGTSYKKSLVYFAACLGTFSYTFPTAFSFAPQLTSQTITTAVVTTINATTASGTGATTTGFASFEGY